MKRAAQAASKAAKKSRAAGADAASPMVARAQGLVDFINASPSPFHAVATAKARLASAGFQLLSERDQWDVQPGGKYMFSRNESALVAFAVGGAYTPGNGFSIVGAHTDSPCLKVKPNSNVTHHGYLSVGVECYGGLLAHTWFDRDLGLAGRVIVRDAGTPGGFASRLVLVDRPIMRIPTLAIHLNRGSADDFKFNKEAQLQPILATAVKAELEAGQDDGEGVRHHAVLLRLLASELGVDVEAICDFELCLFDTQGANLGGICNEFVFAPRLDNLCMSYTAVEALVDSVEAADGLAADATVRMAALFDNEEVGSNSVMGAASTLVEQTMQRVCGADQWAVTARNSLLVSADMAHAIHPNYAQKHEDRHRPAIHKGTVIKSNANQRYATTSVSAMLMRDLAVRNNIPVQDFVVRNDSPCGSTIGPIMATRCGIRTIDIGAPQLSMHSIREMCGTDDITHALDWLRVFYQSYNEMQGQLTEAD